MAQDRNDVVQILTNTANFSEPRMLRAPTYFRVEGADVSDVTLQSCRTKDFSTEIQTEREFTNTARSVVLFGVIGIYYRINAPTAGVIAFRAPAKTSMQGAVI